MDVVFVQNRLKGSIKKPQLKCKDFLFLRGSSMSAVFWDTSHGRSEHSRDFSNSSLIPAVLLIRIGGSFHFGFSYLRWRFRRNLLCSKFSLAVNSSGFNLQRREKQTIELSAAEVCAFIRTPCTHPEIGHEFQWYIFLLFLYLVLCGAAFCPRPRPSMRKRFWRNVKIKPS